MTLVPGVNQQTMRSVWTTSTEMSMASNFVNLLMPTVSTSSLLLDGAAPSGATFNPITGTSWSNASLSVRPGIHGLSVPGGVPLSASVYGFDWYDAYAMPASILLPSNGFSFTPPSAPTNLSAIGGSSTEIDLSWTDNGGGAAGFRIERSPITSTAWQVIGQVPAGTTTYHDTGLTDLSTYQYRVYAYNNANSGYSNVAIATTTSVAPSAAPTNLVATTFSSTRIDLTWSDSAVNESGYKIERRTGVTGTYAQIALTGVNATTYSDSGLTPNTTYYYRVRATNYFGDSAYSNEAYATTVLVQPDAPGRFVAAACGTDKVILYWQGVSAAIGYNVYRANSSGGPYGLVNASPVATSDSGPGVVNGFKYVDSGLSPGLEYFYVVTAVGADCEGPAGIERSDIPNARAIPWDSGDPQLIVAKANYENPIDNPSWNPSGQVTVEAPDRVLYVTHCDGSPPSAVAPSGYYDSATDSVVDSSGIHFPYMREEIGSPDQAQGQVRGGALTGYTNADGTGIYRKVEAWPGYGQFQGIVTFPTGTSLLNHNSSSGDTADIYTGGQTPRNAAGEVEFNIDIGFQMGVSTDSWGLFALCNYSGNTEREFKDIVDRTFDQQIRVKNAALIAIQAPVSHGDRSTQRNGVLFFTVTTFDPSWMVRKSADFENNGYQTTALPYYAASTQLYIPGWTPEVTGRFRWKRVNSIAQYTRSAKHPTAPRPNAPYGGTDPRNGYCTSGARVPGACWGLANGLLEQAIYVNSSALLYAQGDSSSTTFNAGQWPDLVGPISDNYPIDFDAVAMVPFAYEQNISLYAVQPPITP